FLNVAFCLSRLRSRVGRNKRSALRHPCRAGAAPALAPRQRGRGSAQLISGRSRNNRRNCPSPRRTPRACRRGNMPPLLSATAFSCAASPHRRLVLGGGPAVTPAPIDATGETAGATLAMAAPNVPAPPARSRARLLSAESVTPPR